jgi:predicted transcriptional regulator
MKVKDVMTTEIISVDKDEDLSHILALMKKHDITKIPVLENKKFFGIITDNMIAYKLGSIRKREITASRLHASSVVEKKVPIISADEDVSSILRKVGEPGPTMLPVLQLDGHLIGILTKADILHLVNSTDPVSKIMQKKLSVVPPDDRVVHARRIMVDEQIARLPVVGQGSVVGIISDMEIAFAFAKLKESYALGQQKHHLEELLVQEIMKSPVIWTNKTLKIADSAKLMLKHDIGSLPIIDDDKLIGIITRTDILKTVVL